ncbi:TPA: hypothetical protein HIF32_000712 [Escherichia coli]|uniref:hypothetical protein n=1 Tax=Escherichia coli TaxID=562 RepID=UPI0002E55149|nr:hypothetical protein [Escherichia coli O20]EEZ6950781.1 hypothetical protein [Escherichia coli]KDT71492.1 hypothetical protein AC06_0579 [Escherichia coli 3-373-03_S3_C1]EFA3698295.1 hypothetical protein [Escherichia coli]EFD8765776.1 hypothetical protein [Escherichia coli]
MIPDDVLARVFPAPAGINRRCAGVRRTGGGVPRASGDKPLFLQRVLQQILCSPRQRG